MAFDNRDFDLKAPQHITLENREHLSISGVEEVERFDETTIVLSTSLGELVVRGQDLHIETLSLGGGVWRSLSRIRPGHCWAPSGWERPRGCCTTCSGCCGYASLCAGWGRCWICSSGCAAPSPSFSGRWTVQVVWCASTPPSPPSPAPGATSPCSPPICCPFATAWLPFLPKPWGSSSSL